MISMPQPCMSPSQSISSSASLALTASSSDTFDEYDALIDMIELIAHGETEKDTTDQTRVRVIGENKKKKHKQMKRKTKRKIRKKFRKSQKKAVIIAEMDIIHSRKFIRINYDIDAQISVSYTVERSSLRSVIRIKIENVSECVLKKVRFKWYQKDNNTKTVYLSKTLKVGETDEYLWHIYEDEEGHKYSNNKLWVKVKYTQVSEDAWKDTEIIPKKSQKFNIRI